MRADEMNAQEPELLVAWWEPPIFCRERDVSSSAADRARPQLGPQAQSCSLRGERWSTLEGTVTGAVIALAILILARRAYAFFVITSSAAKMDAVREDDW